MQPQPRITLLERKLATRLLAGHEVDPAQVRALTMHELSLTCFELDGLERLAAASDRSLDDFIRDAITHEVDRREESLR